MRGEEEEERGQRHHGGLTVEGRREWPCLQRPGGPVELPARSAEGGGALQVGLSVEELTCRGELTFSP